MTILRIDADRRWNDLARARRRRFRKPGCRPRETVYGAEPGLIPFGEAMPDQLVDPADYKSVIEHCHAQKIFPLYHQRATWAPTGYQWTQNGLNFCWAWGLGASMMDCGAAEGRPTRILSPVTLGWLVRWRNSGNYLADAVRGALERGIATMAFTPDPHDLSRKSFVEGWEADALENRLAEAWDADTSSKASAVRYAISILKTGRSLYIAYDWWGHALSCCGVVWDETQPNNLIWLLRNSHDEDDVIEMTGDRAVPDEIIGIRANRIAA
jgi:hypothetical protein